MTDWLDKSLHSLAAEDPPAEALAEVRMRVLERVQPKRRNWLWWVVPAAAAAGFAVWFVLPEPAVAPQHTPVQIASKAPDAAPVETRQTQIALPAKPVRIGRPARPAPLEAAKSFEPRILPTGSPDFVRIESGNPNVVILWSMNSPTVTDQSGENK